MRVRGGKEGAPGSACAVEDGSLPKALEETMRRLQPESAYFGPEGGVRTAFIVFDLKDPLGPPPIAEPLFRMEMFPVMNQEDLQKGLQQLAGGA
jgi:hypothetical protein